ncbi:MAG: ComF family protein [Terriglobia bacterium]
MPVCAACLSSPTPLEADYFCSSCRTPFRNRFPLDDHGVCAACRTGLRAFDNASSFGFYEGSLRGLVHLFKYSGMKPLAGPLAGFLEQAIPIDSLFDGVVAVPLHWRKRWKRGFNQAELLARQIARRKQIPLLKVLRRKRPAATQASLAMAGRRRNVVGAFALCEGSDLAGKRLLLIDDVMTTGATANACASLLKRGGAKSVSLATIARVDRRWTS